MDWTCLPVAGGLYDQHPDLIDGFGLVMQVEGAIHRQEQDKQKREMEKQRRKAKR